MPTRTSSIEGASPRPCDDETRSCRVITKALWVAFVTCLAVRFGYVFYNGPFEHLFSDPYRHWENGRLFFAPTPMGSIDPFGYQFWLWVLQRVDRGTRYIVLAGTGVLSMALPFFWLKALRELLPLPWALAGAVVIGFMPSLFMIYGYFMNETLLLSLVACGFWLTLRGLRTHDLLTLMALALLWALAGYTRIIALPLAAVCFLATMWPLKWPRRAALASAIGVCFGALAFPACWHSSKNLNYCAPFGSGYLNATYRASPARTMEVHLTGKAEYSFTSPSMLSTPFAPFSDWESSRAGMRRITIDLAKGRRDWEAKLTAIRGYDWRLPWPTDFAENAVMLLFDNSWPDNNPAYRWGLLSIWNRWLWLPLTLAVAVLLLKVRPSLRDALIPGSAIALITLLLVQTGGVMEGRYRKPVEPLLLAGAVVLLHRLRAQQSSRNACAASPPANERAIMPMKI